MAAYFPRGQQDFRDLKAKLRNDLANVESQSAAGIAFVTNQEIKLYKRKELAALSPNKVVDLFHLERIAHILDNRT